MVAVHAVGAGAAAAADLVVFAHAALARVTGLVAELQKVFALAPYLRKGHFAHVAAVQFEVAAGLYLPHVADKAKTRAAKAAACESVHTEGFGCYADAFFLGALAHDAVVVRRAGGFEVHAGALAKIIQPVQHVFVFLRGDDLIGQAGGTAHGHQQKDVPCGCADTLAQLEYLFEAAQIVARDRGVDLKGHAHGFKVFDAAQRSLERAGYAPEAVVTGGVWPVNGNGAAVDPGILDFLRVLGGYEGAVGRKGAGQALAVGIGHQLVHVGPHHGVAAGKDDDGLAHLREGIDESLGFFRRKLAGVRLRVGLGTAVLAGQVAGAGHFPGDEATGGAAVLKSAQGG
ncbi:hypothetical protein SDC9_06845 [bioreactor metagenome]|uniref:Uncharacterized protein n=1 Tax=bioreactor metagenome TaxID=1076179 RepID=A0A644T2Z8_9ZZZZ